MNLALKEGGVWPESLFETTLKVGEGAKIKKKQYTAENQHKNCVIITEICIWGSLKWQIVLPILITISSGRDGI